MARGEGAQQLEPNLVELPGRWEVASGGGRCKSGARVYSSRLMLPRLGFCKPTLGLHDYFLASGCVLVPAVGLWPRRYPTRVAATCLPQAASSGGALGGCSTWRGGRGPCRAGVSAFCRRAAGADGARCAATAAAMVCVPCMHPGELRRA